MAREDYKDKYTEYIKTPSVEQRSVRIHELIDAMVDDFESRVCGNCVYYHQEYLCLEIGNGDFKPDKDFGCNKFSMREDNGRITLD